MKKEHEAWKEAKIPISTAVNPVSPHAVHVVVVVVVGRRCQRRGATLNRQGQQSRPVAPRSKLVPQIQKNAAKRETN